jgi:tRNA dimethylallyltransferase
VAFLAGRLPWEEAIDQAKKDTRRYAKRQLTWFRADPEVRWFHPSQWQDMLALLQDFLEGTRQAEFSNRNLPGKIEKKRL